MRRKSVKRKKRTRSLKKKETDRNQKIAIMAFVLTIILALGAYYHVWQGQTYGKTVKGARDLAEIWMKREAMQKEVPSTPEMFSMDADRGCCVWMERPSLGSQLTLNVPPGGRKCYEDPLVRQQVARGYIIVDVTRGLCQN